MEDLRDTVEDLRETGEIKEQATKVRVTVLILIVTILGTIAAAMASLADAQAAAAQRSQQAQALAAQRDQDVSASSLFSYDDRSSQAQLYFDRDAAWWIERNTAPAQTARTMQATWLQRSQAWQHGISASANGYWNAFASSEKAGELTDVDGQTVAAWREREEGYVTAAAVLAVSLFLVGLVLTTHRRPYRRVFAAASVLLAVFACIRMAQTAGSEIPGISQAALTAYADGEQALYQGRDQSAVMFLERVVAQRPDTPPAWFGLGEALDSGAFPSRADLTRAVAAYRQVIAGGASTSQVQDNLAFDELRLGWTRQARRDIASALDTSHAIDWSYAQGTLAEINMVNGDPAQALADLSAAVNKIDEQRDPSVVHGFFASLRDDQAYFARAGVPQARWQPFYAAANTAEASLDALYQPRPGQLGSAAIGGLKVRYYQIDQAGGQGLLRFRFSYSGFAKDGVFSFRTYEYSGGQYQLLDESSAVRTDQWTWGTGKGTFSWYIPLTVTSGSTYHIEFYWNGNLLASVPATA